MSLGASLTPATETSIHISAAFATTSVNTSTRWTRIYELAVGRRCCLICLEHSPEECHRSVVAEVVQRIDGSRLRVGARMKPAWLARANFL